MKKLFLPILFDSGNHAPQDGGVSVVLSDAQRGFYSEETAKEYARKIALNNPKSKVVVFEAKLVIEPRKIEFAEKSYNEKGELLV